MCRWALVAATTLLGACSSGGGGARHDASVYDVSVELPPGCPPAQGNDKGVGIACTMGGNECTRSGMPPNLRCTCDSYFGIQLYGVPCVCTLVGLNPNPGSNPSACAQLPSGYCGMEATCCDYMSAGYFCSPDICLPGGQCLVFTGPDGGM